MTFSTSLPRIGLSIAVATILLTAATSTPASATPPGRVALPDTSAQEQFGTVPDMGPVPANTILDLQVLLNVHNSQALAIAAHAMSDPHSPAYQHYLTATQVHHIFGLTSTETTAVTTWLTSTGATIVPQQNWRYLDIHATAAQLDQAFDVDLHSYDTSGEIAPTTELSVPADISQFITGTTAFQTLVQQATATSTTPAAATPDIAKTTPNTCSTYWGQNPATTLPTAQGKTQPYAVCGYTPEQIAHAYGLDLPNITGAGQTIAVIMSQDATITQDVNTWSTHVGAPTLAPGQLVQLTGLGKPNPTPAPDDSGAALEGTLDIEAVHGMAPGAHIVSLGGGDPLPYVSLLDEFSTIVDQHLATITSMSAGIPNDQVAPATRTADDHVFEEGALTGTGFYFGTGDGANNPAIYPAASTWATAVGGTSLGISASGNQLWQTGWGDDVTALSANGTAWTGQQLPAGAGGGPVPGIPQPWYQHGVVPDALATDPNGQLDRVGADIAMDADGDTGMLVGGHAIGQLTGQGSVYAESAVGGTSLATPLFAAVQALAQQVNHSRPIGFANPALYQRYHSEAFQDVTAAHLPDGTTPAAIQEGSFYGIPGPFLDTMSGTAPASQYTPNPPTTTPGYDEVTGLGTPTRNYLLSW